jgi:hypothetical protein
MIKAMMRSALGNWHFVTRRSSHSSSRLAHRVPRTVVRCSRNSYGAVQSHRWLPFPHRVDYQRRAAQLKVTPTVRSRNNQILIAKHSMKSQFHAATVGGDSKEKLVIELILWEVSRFACAFGYSYRRKTLDAAKNRFCKSYPNSWC